MHIGAGFPLYKKAPSDEGALSGSRVSRQAEAAGTFVPAALYKLFLCVQTPNHLFALFVELGNAFGPVFTGQLAVGREAVAHLAHHHVGIGGTVLIQLFLAGVERAVRIHGVHAVLFS